MEENVNKNNPLGTEAIPILLRRFAIPSIVAMLIGAFYNIVDQLFIGNYVGTLGNAATNVAFPLSTACIALALLGGIGGASNFNLNMGRGEPEKAIRYVGNALTMLFCSGLLLFLVTRAFLTPILVAFGTPDSVLPYAQTYVGITSIGFPFLILTSGGCHLIRADGSPTFSMICNVLGAVINTVLDALFVVGFGWGMAGAAWATVIGQIISGVIVVCYMRHFKTVPLKLSYLLPQFRLIRDIALLGMSACLNQLAMIIVQIIVNNSLTHYGALSEYGEAIPLACCGIVMKVNQIYFSIVIGLSQSSQPLFSFNYGARLYDRVRKTYRLAIITSLAIGVIAFLAFQFLPRQILMLFGDNTEEYFDFGVRFFRIFLFFTWANGIQAITSTFFAAIGKPMRGVLISMTRQVILFIPLALILPRLMGLFGVLYTSPIADSITAVLATTLAVLEFRQLKREEAGR